MATTHQMKVDMKNDLPTAMVDVHHQTITVVGNATLTRQPISYKGEARQPHRVIRLDVQKGWHMPFRHDEEVDRRARMNILDGQ